MRYISEALDQYSGICKEDLHDCASKLSKSFESAIIDVLLFSTGSYQERSTSLGFEVHGAAGHLDHADLSRSRDDNQKYCGTGTVDNCKSLP